MTMIDPSTMTREEKIAFIQAAEELITRQKRNHILTLFPDAGPLRRELYPQSTAFFAAGATHKQRLFMASNRTSKTLSGAYEVSMHATGRYPHWWTGKRFDHPVDIWVAGKNSKTVRDIIQRELLGPPTDIGTGMLPYDTIGKMSKAMGTADYIDTVNVRHVSGGYSTIGFKSYDQGRQAFEGTAKHIIWLDEETPQEVYTECLIRTMTTDGIVLLTFTPLMGMTPLVVSFTEDDDPGKCVITATWDNNAPHLSEETKAAMFAALPPHQRDARSRGIPQLGAGAVYPVPESDIVVEPFKIPPHWKRCYALDVGWNRTAAVFAAIDPESGACYITHEYYVGDVTPIIHSAALKQVGADWQNGVIDPASRGRGQDDGQKLLDQYKAQGLRLSTANNAVEAGLYSVWEGMITGQLKVFNSCTNWLKEFRLYRRDEKGHIVKKDDHLMDATRYMWMSGRDKASVKAPAVQNNPQQHLPSKRFSL